MFLEDAFPQFPACFVTLLRYVLLSQLLLFAQQALLDGVVINGTNNSVTHHILQCRLKVTVFC